MAKILILAPKSGALDSLSDAVQEAGWTPVIMHDGSRALSDFSSLSPALVVLDLQIEEGKGVDLCHRIRGIDGGDLVPILLLGTGSEGIRNFGDALVEGGDYYFERPLKISKVILKIRTYVGVDREATTLVAPPPTGETRAAPKKSAPKDLAERVEQMMDMGAAFKEGLLEPPGDQREPPDDAIGTQAGAAEKESSARPLVNSPETTSVHKIDPSMVGGLLPPGGKEAPKEKRVRAAFPQRPDKNDENVLSPPAESGKEDATDEIGGESRGVTVSRLFAELKEELEATEERDELAEEAQAWSELAQEEQEDAEEKPRKEKEEKVRREAEEQTRRDAEEKATEARRVVLALAYRESDRRTRSLIERIARQREEDRIRREAQEKARREAQDKARREAQDKASREAQDKARREAQDKARREAHDKARREAEEKARRESEEKARREAQEKARREAEEKARREADLRDRQEASRKARAEAERRAQPEDEEKAIGLRSVATEPAGVPRDEDPFGDRELLQAESLWADALQEARTVHADRAEEPKKEAWPATMGAGDKLVRLLQREAILAREQAVDEDGISRPLDLDTIPTVPGLPPRPGDERAERPSLAKIRTPGPEPPAQEEDFQREETADIRPPGESGQYISDEDFDEPKTSPILDMRTLAIRSAKSRLRRQEIAQGRESLLDHSGLPVTCGMEAQDRGEEFFGQDQVFAEPSPQPFMACNPARADLAQEMVPAIFFRLLTQETTGQVIFINGNDQKEVFFEVGVPVAIRSTQTADRLEEMLFREGLIDRAAYAEARIKGIGPPRALAAHLVERNLLRPEEYFPLVRRHFEDCLLGLFEWTTGQAEYHEETTPDAEMIRLARTVPWLILEGIRRKFLLERMVRKLGSPSSLLAAVAPDQHPRQLADLRSAGFLPAERTVLGLVNGLRPIEEIVFLSGHTAITVYRVLLAGVLMGLLTVTVKGIRGGGENEEEILKTNLEIARRRIEAKFDQINHASYFEILGVSETSTAYEVEAAYRLLSTEFHPMHFAHPALETLAEKLATIRTTLEEARDVLTDDLLRTGYQQSLMNGSK
ncbi:MAG TPA: DUF4388 domain-containing protein [Myxococcota bacterium]|nr:DUF4388 domain-containing protein [Myxococcota bacterium]